MEFNKQYVFKTNKKAIDIINKVGESKLKFLNFGSFLLEFFLLDTRTQMTLATHLLTLSKNPDLNDYYVIKGFHKLGLNVTDAKWEIILNHSFKCKYCGIIEDNTTNAFDGKLRNLCERCTDIAYEYAEESENYQEYLDDCNL